jgi:Tol biopolymer transport system component
VQIRRLLFTLPVVLVILTACGATPGAGSGNGPGNGDADEPGPALLDSIAYVTAATRDDIRVIDPDGGNDRLLWSHGQEDPSEVSFIWDLDWSPDSRELAFTSTHESGCSLLYSDVYAVGTNGGNYRRLSGPPACGALSAFPSATVRVPVRNGTLDSIDIFLYFLGAPESKQVSLPAGGTTTVTFEDVADFGAGVLQYAMMINGSNRELASSAAVDVQPNGSHTTAELEAWAPAAPGWEARSPSWHSDGSRLGYAFNFNTLYSQPAFPKPLELGDDLIAAAEMPNLVTHLNWNPASEWSQELLYVGWTPEASSIYWVEEGSTTAGSALLTFETWEKVLGLAWLPDGNGFVFSVVEGLAGDLADLWEFSFETSSATRITNFTGEYAGELSVSPDGQEIVFERSAEFAELAGELVAPDLWLVGRDGSNLRLLREDAAAPDWSGN